MVAVVDRAKLGTMDRVYLTATNHATALMVSLKGGEAVLCAFEGVFTVESRVSRSEARDVSSGGLLWLGDVAIHSPSLACRGGVGRASPL